MMQRVEVEIMNFDGSSSYSSAVLDGSEGRQELSKITKDIRSLYPDAQSVRIRNSNTDVDFDAPALMDVDLNLTFGFESENEY